MNSRSLSRLSEYKEGENATDIEVVSNKHIVGTRVEGVCDRPIAGTEVEGVGDQPIAGTEESAEYIGIDMDRFAQKVVKALKTHYREGYSIRISKQQKNNNIIMTGVLIANEKNNVVPSIYLEDYLERYNQGMSLNMIVQSIIRRREEADVGTEIDMSFYTDYEKVRDKLTVKLINTSLNDTLLDRVPHIDYLDLSIVFIVMINNDHINGGSVLINNDHLKAWGKSLEELYEDAVKNSVQVNPLKVENIIDIMKRQYMEHMRNSKEYSSFHDLIPNEDIPMYVVSNESGCFGASAILYPGVLSGLGEKYGDYYISPSSVHELIIVPEEACDNRSVDLNSMINEVNTDVLKVYDILSDHAYYYDHSAGEVSIID